MRVLYVYCHPLEESFHFAIRGRALEGLKQAGHDVDLLDLYAEGFQPVLTADQRRHYHDLTVNQLGVEDYARRLMAAEGLVVQFPVWSFGAPAMLKGFVDRMFLPGVAFDISDPANVKRMLNYRRLAGITTYGRPRSRAFVVGDPPRRWVTRYLRLMGRGLVRTDYHALYHVNVADLPRRQAFLDKVGRAMARFRIRMRKLYWSELKTTEFAGLDPETTIVVWPMAAIEQHGPHLPVATDTAIAEGMVATVLAKLPDDLSILILPTQTVGKSNEHLRSPGTITLSAETALRAWVEIGEAVHRAGLRKLVMVNSHGGNADLISIVSRELRVRFGMLVVSCSWSRFGRPPGLYTDEEAAVGIHAGDIETSLMLHFRPDLVDMTQAANFAPVSIEMAREFDLLRPTGFTAFGWIAPDLHPSGAAGDASRGTAEKGKLTADYSADAFIRLLRDVTRFRLDRLA